MRKRGIGHIEVILAFILFVGFLLFGLYFLNPLDSGRVLDSSLFYAKDAIKDNVSSNLLVYSIIIDSPSDAVSVPLSIEGIDGGGVRVERNNGLRHNSSYQDGKVSF